MTAAADSTPESTVDEPTGSEAPAEAVDAPVEEAPVEDAVEDTAVGDAVEEAPAADAVDEMPVEDAVDEMPVEGAVDEMPVEDAVEETSTDAVDAPVEETSTEAAVVEAAAAEDAPAAAAGVAEADAEAAAAEDSAAEEPAEEPAAGETPSRPAPGIPSPAAFARTSRPAAAPSEPWGRVDEDGTVSVREADGWRVVGQYPDGTPEEALAYYERKYADLAGEVGLLEVRQHRGGASAADLRSAARAVSEKLDGAAAVGDLASLTARVAALTATLAAASESEAAAAREATDAAIRSRTEIVEKVEAIAGRDPKSTQWKQASAEVSALFDQWQSQQQHGPRLPKSTAQQLWKRFRDARATFDKHRREFYAELDEAHKGVRERKTRLVEKAEALAPKGEDGIPAYRELLDEWKTSGRAGKKVDDALWARFKAAGDALYSARVERETADAEASREKIGAKRALLAEASAVADEREIAKARTLLTGIQRRWDEIGRIQPREAERSLDDELRKVETALRLREETDWKRNNPETKARANDMTRQLTDAIVKLEDELAAAEKSGDKSRIAKATEALEARRSWLKALGGA